MRCCFSVLCASALSGRRGIPPRNMVLYLRSLNFSSTIFLSQIVATPLQHLIATPSPHLNLFSFLLLRSTAWIAMCPLKYDSEDVESRNTHQPKYHSTAQGFDSWNTNQPICDSRRNLSVRLNHPFPTYKKSQSLQLRRYEENPLTRWTSSPPLPSSSGRNSTKKAKQSQQGLQYQVLCYAQGCRATQPWASNPNSRSPYRHLDTTSRLLNVLRLGYLPAR